jgi:hypothetical protein
MKKESGRRVWIQSHNQPFTTFLRWLCGVDSAGFGREARSSTALLPMGVQASSPRSLAQAVGLALDRHDLSADAIVRFVFSRLSSYDRDKAMAVVSSLMSRVPSDQVPALVRAAVIVRPRLAMTVVLFAATRAPSEAKRIWEAAESVVVGLAPVEDVKSGVFPTG